MIQINLVPDVKLELIKAQKHRNLVISVAIIAMAASAIVVIVLASYVFIGQAFFQSQLTNQIASKDKEFRAKPDIEKTVTIRNQLKNIQATHEMKTMSSRIFDLLAEASAKDTDNAVSINSIVLDTSQHTISIVAQTDKKGFDAADVFRKNIDGMKLYYKDADENSLPTELSVTPQTTAKDEKSVTIASDVQLSDLSYAQSEKDGRKTVSFKLTFEYDPLLFDEKIDLLRLRGLDRGNVTDSYTRLPKSLFLTSDGSDNGGAK